MDGRRRTQRTDELTAPPKGPGRPARRITARAGSVPRPSFIRDQRLQCRSGCVFARKASYSASSG
jgi:hypothetical protein